MSVKSTPLEIPPDVIERLRAEVQEAPDSRGITTRELAAAFGCSLAKARDIIRHLIRCGKAKSGSVRRASDLTGIIRPIPSYEIDGITDRPNRTGRDKRRG